VFARLIGSEDAFVFGTSGICWVEAIAMIIAGQSVEGTALILQGRRQSIQSTAAPKKQFPQEKPSFAPISYLSIAPIDDLKSI
jgi:hypothetical protein